MSESMIALLVTAACIGLLIGWVPCIDRLMRFRPTGAERREFQRAPRERVMVTDEEVRQLLRRKPFLPYADMAATTQTMRDPALFTPSETGPRPTRSDSL